jgi:hypothetical protein
LSDDSHIWMQFQFGAMLDLILGDHHGNR